MRQQTEHIAGWLAFHITVETAEKDKPCGHGPILQQRQRGAQIEGEKPRQTPCVPEKPHPDTRLLLRGRTENPRFLADRHGQASVCHHYGQATYGQYARALTATGAASGRIELRPLLHNAHTRTFKARADIGTAVREYAGYGRLEGLGGQALPAAVYAPLVPLLNLFMPDQKFKNKTRAGSKEIKAYDEHGVKQYFLSLFCYRKLQDGQFCV
jgi:hypothetical protein